MKDHIQLIDIEKRVKELKLQYEELKRMVCEEAKKQIYTNFTQRDAQASDLQKKDEELQKFLTIKKNEFESLKKDIDHDDIDLQTKL